MSEWKQEKLSNLITIKHGYAFSGEFITSEKGLNILVTPGNFNIGGGFKSSKYKYYSNNDYPCEYKFKGEEIIVTMTDLSKETDTLGYSAKVPTDGKTYLHNQRVGLVQIINKSVYEDFIYWLMRSKNYQEFIANSASGTSVMHTSPSKIGEYEFCLPTFLEQKAIASVLSSLDDKIDLLHRQNKTLEAMAETLFRQWFMEDIASDEIIKLDEIIIIHDSKRIPLSKLERDKKKTGNILYPYYGAAKIMDYIDDYIFEGEYLLLGEDGTVQDENGYPILQRTNGRFWCNNHAHVLSAKEPYNIFFLWCLLSKTNIENAITGAVQPKINQENLKKIEFLKFDISRVSHFVKLTESFFVKIKSNTQQIQTLENLRDTLLPKLMSGEVRVKVNDKSH